MTKGLTLTAVSFSLLLQACTTLSPDAARIMTIRDGGVMAMMDCSQLGFVSGDAGIWGGTAGLDSAIADAKNEAAQIPGANAMLITSSQMNPTSRVNATVYDCSQRSPQRIEVIYEPEQQTSNDEVIGKARRCQELGGVWINDSCIIEVD